MPELAELTWRGGTCHQDRIQGEEMMSEDPTTLCYLKVSNLNHYVFFHVATNEGGSSLPIRTQLFQSILSNKQKKRFYSFDLGNGGKQAV